MREQIKTALILVLGWSFVVLGFIGLFLPILQGVILILVGLYLLSKRSKFARKLLQNLYNRYPRLAVQLKLAQHKGEDFTKRIRSSQVKRGTAPKTAPTYIKEEKKIMEKQPSYKCTVCGYIYDPEVGDPDSGIKPGTPFEEIPDDWVCPVCGVGKDQFEQE